MDPITWFLLIPVVFITSIAHIDASLRIEGAYSLFHWLILAPTVTRLGAGGNFSARKTGMNFTEEESWPFGPFEYLNRVLPAISCSEKYAPHLDKAKHKQK